MLNTKQSYTKQDGSKSQARTVRGPQPIFQEAAGIAQSSGKSLNAVLAEALAKGVKSLREEQKL